MRVCVAAPLTALSGNWVTASRIASYVAGTLVDTNGPLDEVNATFDVCFLLHAVRSGFAVLPSAVVGASGATPPRIAAHKFVLIFGGTDVNEFANDSQCCASIGRLLEHVSAVVCFSPCMKTRAAILWPCAASKLLVVPQAAQCTASRCGADRVVKSLHLSTDRFVLWVGALRAVKDPVFAIKSWRLAMSTALRAEVTLVLVGVGLEDDVREAVSAAAHSDHALRWVPGLSREEVHALLSHRRVLCCMNTSRSEGQPQAILEAMLLGVPVLLRDIPVNRELLGEAVDGLRHERGYLLRCESDLAVALRDMLDFRSVTEDTARRAKEFVASVHSVEAECRAYRRIVSELTSTTSNL